MEKENKVLEQIVEASEIEVPQEFIDERKEQLKNTPSCTASQCRTH